jgi:hypothetical protein
MTKNAVFHNSKNIVQPCSVKVEWFNDLTLELGQVFYLWRVHYTNKYYKWIIFYLNHQENDFGQKNICVSADHIDLNVSVYSKVIITIFGQVLLMSDPCPVKPDKYC